MADALSGRAGPEVYDPVQRIGLGRRGGVRHCALSPDGAAALLLDRELKVCDLNTGRFHVKSIEAVIGMARAVDRRVLFWTARDLYEWDFRESVATRLTRGKRDHHVDAAVALADRSIASAHREQAGSFLRVYRYRGTKTSMVYQSDPRSAPTLWMAGFGARGFACGLGSGAVELWTIPKSGPARHRSLVGHLGPVLHGALAGQRHLVTASTDLTIRLWSIDWTIDDESAPTGRADALLEGHADEITDLAVTPDGRRLATASRDRTIRLWTIPEGRPIKTLVDHRDWVTHMAINPAGTHMASCSADGMIKVWDLETLECTGTAFGLGRFLCLAMSADTICAGDSTGNFWTLLYGVRREPQSRAPRS